jgi:AcrR family transcriptional regulator
VIAPTVRGLREAKKRATARELAVAAYTLVRERGYDAVTIDDIAAEAGYSRRTFANHYASKPEAVVDGFLAHATVLGDLDPTVVPTSFDDVIDASEAYVLGIINGPVLDDVRALALIAHEHPVLESTAHARMQAYRAALAKDALGERFGSVRVHLFVGAVIGLLSGALHVVVADGVESLGCLVTGADPAPVPPAVTPELRAQLSTLVAEAFTHLRHGFAERPTSA